MKRKIIILRAIGIITFASFIISVSCRANFETLWLFTQFEKLLTFISGSSFVIILTIQLYRFYFKKILPRSVEIPLAEFFNARPDRFVDSYLTVNYDMDIR